MADDIVDQLNAFANSLPRDAGKSTAWGAAAEIIRLRSEARRLRELCGLLADIVGSEPRLTLLDGVDSALRAWDDMQ